MKQNYVLLIILLLHTTFTKVTLTKPITLNKIHFLEKQKIKEDYKVGQFTRTVYSGNWNSNNRMQNSFLTSKKGLINIAFSYDPTNDPKNLLFAFEIFKNHYLDEKFIIARMKIPLNSKKQTNLKSKQKVEIKKYSNFYTNKGIDFKTLNLDITINNIHGKQLDISTDKISDIIISGEIYSQKGDIRFEFETMSKKIELVEVLIFLMINIFCVVLNGMPFYLAVKNQDFSQLSKINDSVILINICLDFILISVNTTFSMRILFNYFEYLVVLTLYFMVVLVFKVKVYLILFQRKMEDRNLTFDEMKKIRFRFIFKFVFCSIFSIFVSFFFVVHYYLFLIAFSYPVIQIIYNSCANLKKHCFDKEFHLLFFLPQILMPICIRGISFNFFQLKPDHNFSLALISIMVISLFIMYLQKSISPSFFLPKILKPNFFNYEKKIEDLEENHSNCPICFEDIKNSNMEARDEEKVKSKFFTNKFMKTPCGHSFHSYCLKSWMDQKFICPCCRANIPAYE